MKCYLRRFRVWKLDYGPIAERIQWESLDPDGKSELGCNNWKVAFGHDDSRCLKDYKVNMAWRVFYFLAIFAIQIFSWVDFGQENFRYYYIYLTHWTLTLQLIFVMLNLAVGYYSQDDSLDPHVFPWFAKASWVLSGILLPATFMVFALYWGLVWTGPEVKAVSVCTHGVNFLLQAIDTTLSSHPRFLLHGIYFFMYGLTYVIWTLIHYALFLDNQYGQPYVYSSLNWWNHEKTAPLAAIIILVVIPILNILMWVTVNCANKVGATKVTPADPPQAEEAPADPPQAEEAPVEVPAPAEEAPAEVAQVPAPEAASSAEEKKAELPPTI